MKKIILCVAAVAFMLANILFFAQPTFALEPCACENPMSVSLFGNCEKNGQRMYCDGSGNGGGIFYIVSFVVNILMAGIGILGTIGIIWCGFIMLTARDNEGQVAKAKKRLLDIVIGLVAFGLMWMIVELLLPGGSLNMLNVNNGNQSGGISFGNPEPITSATSPGTTGGSSQPSASQPSSSSTSSAPASSTTGDKIRNDDKKCGPEDPSLDKLGKTGKAKDGKTITYTTTTGRLYYDYKQADSRWGSTYINTTSEGKVHTLANYGCLRTSTAIILSSYGASGLKPTDFVKGWGGVESAVNKKGGGYVKYNGFTSTRSKMPELIRKTIVDDGGAVIIRVHAVFTSSQHHMPLVDYRVNNGKAQAYIANTTTKYTGWYDIDKIVNDGKADGLYMIIPTDSSVKVCKDRR